MTYSDWEDVGMSEFNGLVDFRLHKLQDYRMQVTAFLPRLMKLGSLHFDNENSLDFYLIALTEFSDIVQSLKDNNPMIRKSDYILLQTAMVDMFMSMKSFLEKQDFISFLKRNLIKTFSLAHHEKISVLFNHLGKSGLVSHFEYDIINICTSYVSKCIPNLTFDGLQMLLKNELLENLASLLLLEGALLERISITLFKFAAKNFCRHHAKKLYAYIMSSDLTGLQQLTAVANEKELLNIIWLHFEKDLEVHLLHVGVTTNSILAHVELGLASLSVIDPSLKLLEDYLRKMKAYLHARRKDYPIEVLKMIERLANGRLHEEFLNPITKVKYDLPDLDPRNFDSCILADVRASTKSENIFAILANFFESSATFVNTYKRMIIHESIVQHIQLEKSVKKFQNYCKNFEGDEWKECLVMIKDFYTSGQMKMNNANNVFNGLVISYLFWPDCSENDIFFLPSESLRANKAGFECQYSGNKYDRKLNWTNSIGYVSLDIQFDNVTLSFECGNDEASVLILLSETPFCTFNALLEMTSFDAKRMKKSLQTWLEKGIILFNELDQLYVVDSYHPRDTNDEYFIDYQLKNWCSDKVHTVVEASKFKDIFEKIFPLILGMLRNMGSLPISKIQSSLGLFSSEYKEQESDLKRFLEHKATSGIIQIKPDGQFCLKSES